MAQSNVILRNARLDETAVMAEVERQCWPDGLGADEAQLTARIEAYPQGQWVAERDGQLVGLCTAQRVNAAFLETNCHSYTAISDNGRFTESHDPQGEIYQLVGVAVLPRLRGGPTGRRLVDQQIEFARSLPDIKRILGFTRPVRYYRYSDKMPIEKYLEQRRPTGTLVDPVVGFHTHAGARVGSIHANFRPEDTASCGYGVLIEYPCNSVKTDN